MLYKYKLYLAIFVFSGDLYSDNTFKDFFSQNKM